MSTKLGRPYVGSIKVRRFAINHKEAIVFMITTVKQLKAEDIRGYSIYKLDKPFTVYHDVNGTTVSDEWTTDEFFIYDHRFKALRAVYDNSLINPSIIFKAKVALLTPKEWAINEVK